MHDLWFSNSYWATAAPSICGYGFPVNVGHLQLLKTSIKAHSYVLHNDELSLGLAFKMAYIFSNLLAL